MCGGGGSAPAPSAVSRRVEPVKPAVVKQAAVTPSGGIKKKNANQQTPAVGFNSKQTMLSGIAGIGDETLNLGGKTILGG